MFNLNIDYIKYEFKKMIADPLMRFMLIYPIILGIVGRFVIPVINDMSNINLIENYSDIIVAGLILLTPQIYGALIGFSLLEDRDDHIFSSIKVTPLSLHAFIWFKFTLVTLMSFIACLFVVWFSNIGNISIMNMIVISFLVSLSVPFTGLLINAFASNKIEGFAIMKGTGIIIVFPIISLFFVDYKEFLFSFAPGFWPAKALSTLVKGNNVLLLNYTTYYLIGLIYVIIITALTYKLFLNRVKL